MIENRDLSLYLMDGEAKGCLRLEFDGYPLVAYKIPRDSFSDIKKVAETEVINNSAIYFLFGNEKGQNTIYVGQAAARKNGNAALQRIPEPHGDTKWNSAVVLTTNDDRLDKTSLCYLENYFYNLAKDAGNYTVTNGVEPSSDNSIKAKDKRILAKYVEHVLVLVEILGYEVFNRKEQSSNASNAIDDKTVFFCTERGGDARGCRTEKDGFVIFSGSKLSPPEPTTTCSKTTLRLLKEYAEYIEDGVLTKNLEFDSPSGAANFVTKRSTNGNIAWVNKDGTCVGEFRRLDK